MLIRFRRLGALCILLALFACDSEKENPDARLPLSKMTIMGVPIRGSHEDVRSALGEPTTKAMHRAGDSVVTTWNYPDVSFSFLEDEIYDIQCPGARCITGAGVKVGARREDVIKAYGPAAYGHNPAVELLLYKDPQGRCALQFRLRRGIVDWIFVQCSKPWDLIQSGR